MRIDKTIDKRGSDVRKWCNGRYASKLAIFIVLEKERERDCVRCKCFGDHAAHK